MASSDKIVNIKTDKDVVETLEELLADARSGKLNGIAYAISYDSENTANGWGGMNKCNMAIVGEILCLQRDFMDAMIDLRINPRTGEEI